MINNRTFKILILAILFNLSSLIHAQTFNIKIWPDGAPGAIAQKDFIESANSCGSLPCWKNVSSPELHVYLPDEKNATGTSVVIFPGGGYYIIAFEIEGEKIAKALNAQGIAAIVVKYRLPSDEIMKDKSIGPLQDAQEAMRIVRRNSAAWKLNPDKIGVMGFSAGGHLAASVSNRFDERLYNTKDKISARPNFSILIYPVISFQDDIGHLGSRENLIGKDPSKTKIDSYSNELLVSHNTPPTFLIHAADDTVVSPENSIRYFDKLREKNVDVELHLFQSGGHGFGLGKDGTTESSWLSLCMQWLKMHTY